MTKITSFNTTNLKDIRADIAKALAAVEAQYGVSLNLGRITYSGSEFRGKLTGTAIATQAKQAATPAPTFNGNFDLAAVARTNILPSNLAGKKFRSNGRLFTLTGVKKSRRKYPFSGMGPQGGRYKFTISQVQNGLVA